MDDVGGRTAQRSPRAAVRALHHALELARQRHRMGARRACEAALAVAPDDPLVGVVAGLVSFVVGDYAVALERLRHTAERGAGARVQWLVHERALRLGWDPEAREALERGATLEPDEPRWPAALLVLHAHQRSCARAIDAGRRTLSLASGSPALHMELAGVYAALHAREETERHVEAALALSTATPVLLEGARLLRIVGAFDASVARSRDVLARDPENAHAHLALAELALWSGDHVTAAAHARDLSATAPSASAHRILGAIAYLEGRTEEAVRAFRAALAIDRREPEAHAWLAQIAILDGRYDDGHAHISSAIEGGSGAIFAGHVLRLRVKLEERPDERYPDEHAAAHLRPTLALLVPEHAHALDGGDRDRWRVLLDLALARMHGNRSALPTFVRDGALRLVPDVRDPRRESRLVLNRIRIDDPDVLVDELDGLARDFPSSGLPLAHKGEILLWMGRLDEARVALDGAIDVVHGTRWAHIGLGAIDLLRGEPARALDTLAYGVEVMLGTSGPAVFVHRGEALLRIGRLEEAKIELTRAIALNPTRLAAPLLLALVELASGEVEAARARILAASRGAPGLFSDAARERGMTFPIDDAHREPPEALEALLEHVMRMMRGNRSSSTISYFTRDGVMRFVGRGGRDPHERDAIDLELARRLLERGVGALPQPTRRESAVDRGDAHRDHRADRVT